jgi:Flp pilus assembly protein CpaB
LGQLLIATSLVLAALTAFSLQRYVASVEAQNGIIVKVLVAAEEIPPRTVLTEQMLDFRHGPLQAMLSGMVPADRTAELIGQTLLVGARKGDVITRAMTGAAQTTDPNLRAYPLYQSERVILPADLAAGDTVDLLASFKDQNGKPVSKVVLTGLRVLHAQQQDRNYQVVLAVSAGDAETLAWHENFGQQLRLLRRQYRKVEPHGRVLGDPKPATATAGSAASGKNGAAVPDSRPAPRTGSG